MRRRQSYWNINKNFTSRLLNIIVKKDIPILNILVMDQRILALKAVVVQWLFGDPTNYISPSSSVHGILQARILEWVAISFSRVFGWVCVLGCFSRVQLLVTLWTVAHRAPLSMGFSREEHWSVLPSPTPEHLPNSGIKPTSPALQADSLSSELPGKPKNKHRKQET